MSYSQSASSSSPSQGSSSVVSAASNAMQGIASQMQGIANRGAVAVAVVLTLLLIVVIIAYIVWRLNRSNLQAIDLVKEPLQLTGKNMPLTVHASTLPAMSVGQEFSVSMWLYLNDFQATSLMKPILCRMPGMPGNRLSGANPAVFLDETTNKLYVAIATNRRPATPKTSFKSLLEKSGKGASNNWTYLVATIDYVPLQRWVHVVFTVQDNTLTLYQDGGMYTVASLFDMVDLTNAVSRPAFAACIGDLTVGNASSSLGSETTGFVARAQFFNYSLSAENASRIYHSGPTDTNLLRSLGVPMYGLRSPVYRVE